MLTPRGRDMLIWMVAFLPLTYATLAFRFVALKRQRRKWRADDWFMIVAVVSMTTLEGTVCWALYNGLGGHTQDLTSAQMKVQYKLQFSANVTWTFATSFCKLTMLYFYTVIFVPMVWFKHAAWVVMALTTAYLIIIIPIFFFACTPVSASWKPELHATHCWPWNYHSISAVSFNMLLDLLVVFLPLPIVWRLKATRKKKIEVTAMFSLGLAIVGVMLWRLIFTVTPRSHYDYPYDLALVGLQAQLEIWLGLIASNLPPMAPLFPLIPRYIPASVKSFFTSQGTDERYTPMRSKKGMKLRTFGSSGPNPRRKNFDPMTDSDLYLSSEESNGNGNVGIEGAIAVEREIDVHVDNVDTDRESAFKIEPMHTTVETLV